VVTHLFKNRRAVFSVLRDPYRGNMRESNSEAGSCRSTEEYKEHKEYKEYNREYEMRIEIVVGRR
jgi:hypothetical protein